MNAIADRHAAAARAARRDLHRLGDLLQEHRVTELSLGPRGWGACRAAIEDAWVIAGVTENGGSATCLVSEDGATCVARAERDIERATRRTCGGVERRIPAPGWLTGVSDLVRSRPDLFHEVSPVAGPAALPALRVHGDSVFGFTQLLVRVRGRWWLAPEPLAEGRGPGILRVLDASALGSGAVVLAVANSYDGGSGMGGGETWLHVFCDADGGLVECARKQIGLLQWNLSPEDREKYPRGAYSLRERPHIEAELEPSVTRGGLLQLSLVYSMLPADRSDWGPDETCLDPAHDPEGGCDPVSTIESLINDAGMWRLEGGRFVPAGK